MAGGSSPRLVGLVRLGQEAIPPWDGDGLWNRAVQTRPEPLVAPPTDMPAPQREVVERHPQPIALRRVATQTQVPQLLFGAPKKRDIIASMVVQVLLPGRRVWANPGASGGQPMARSTASSDAGS